MLKTSSALLILLLKCLTRSVYLTGASVQQKYETVWISDVPFVSRSTFSHLFASKFDRFDDDKWLWSYSYFSLLSSVQACDVCQVFFMWWFQTACRFSLKRCVLIGEGRCREVIGYFGQQEEKCGRWNTTSVLHTPEAASHPGSLWEMLKVSGSSSLVNGNLQIGIFIYFI